MTRRFEGAFTDYDGTIVCEHGTPLRQEVKHAFRRLPGELPVFIATGRSVASAPLFVTDLQPQHEMYLKMAPASLTVMGELCMKIDWGAK